MGSLRVCFVVNAVDETSVPADIATSLVEHTDVTVDLLAWFNAEGFDGDDLVAVTCLGAPDTRIGAGRSTVTAATRVLSEYDLVQTHHNHSGAFAKVIARRLSLPTVSREGNMRKGFTFLGRTANGLTNPLADRVVCNSRAVYESFRWWERLLLPESKVVFIPNGVDLKRIAAAEQIPWNPRDVAGIGEETVLISTAGLLTSQKDHRTLIRAMQLVVERTDDPVSLCIAGDGPLEANLRALSEAVGVSESVYFLGRLDRIEVYKLLSETDIYAMPSKWEGFSAAAVEALGAGTAAVFSDIPPFTGPYSDVARFHPVGDNETLADRLVELVERPDDRRELAEAARSLVEERYRLETVAENYRDLYREIVDT